jgi:hypothetical protein
MADEKSSKGDDGRGIPAGGEQKATEPAPADARLIPGGSFRAARRPIGVNAMDHYDQPPVVKADLPDLSETPGWHMVKEHQPK